MEAGKVLFTSSDLLNTLITLEAYSLISCIAFGVVLAIAHPLFTKLDRQDSSDIIPFYNIFSLCNVVGYNELICILLLFPIINTILIMILSYGLRKRYHTSSLFDVGLLFLPSLFILILAYGNSSPITNEYEYNENDENANMNYNPNIQNNFNEVVVEDITVNKNLNKPTEVEEIKEEEKIDSIFKTEAQTMEEVKPYKAKRVVLDDEFINSKPVERERIERIEKKESNE